MHRPGVGELNELFRSAHTHRHEPFPTYVLLDEFQNFVGPDLADMLPAVRQWGLRLILSHQSFTQLKRGDTDLSAIIFQVQNRLCFGLQGPEDADLMAHELSSLTYDEKAIKHIQYVWRQLLTGFDREVLRGGASGSGFGTSESRSDSHTDSHQNSMTFPADMFGMPIRSTGAGGADSRSAGRGSSQHTTHTDSWHETLVPQHHTYQEPRITFQTFNEWRQIWAREIRRAPTGHAMLQIDGEPDVRHVQIHFDKRGYLKFDFRTLRDRFPRLIEAKERLIEENFRSELFVPAHVIDAEAERRIQRVLALPPLILDPQARPFSQDASTTHTPPTSASGADDSGASDDDPFA